MGKLFKTLFILTGLVVVVIVAAGVAVVNIDPNQHKDWVIEKVKEAKGRDLKLDGNIQVSWYPWLGVQLNGVTLGNAPGFGDQPFLHVDQFEARVKLMPLLHGEYQIDTVRLHGAKLNLARNKQGVTNWADLMSKQASAEKPQPLPLGAVVLGGVDVQNVDIDWNDAVTGAHDSVSKLNASTGPLTYGQPIKLDLSLDARANKPDLAGSLSMNGIVNYDLDKNHYSVKPLEFSGTLLGPKVPGGKTQLNLSTAIDVDLATDTATISALDFKALDTEIRGNLSASRIQSPKPSVQAQLDVNGSDMALIAKVLDLEPLASQLAQVQDRKFVVKTSVNADMEKGDVDVPTLTANVLGTNVQGNVKLSKVGSGKPAVKATLSANGPDLPALLAVVGQIQGGKKSPLTRLSQELADSGDRHFDLRTNLDADLDSGSLDMPELSAHLLGASIDGKIKGSRIQSKTPALQGEINASGPDLPILMRLAGRLQPGNSALADYGRKFAALKDRSFNARVTFNADLKQGNVNVPNLSIQALGLGLSGNLTATNMDSDKGTVNGHLTASGDQLSDVLMAMQQKNLAEVLQSVRIDAGVSGGRSDLALKPLSIKAQLSGDAVGKKPVALEFNADTRMNLDKEQLDLQNLSLTGLGLNASGHLHGDKIMSAPAISGSIDVPAFNLRQTLTRLNQPLPPMADKTALQKVGLQADFAGSKTSVDIKKVALLLDDTHLNGNLSINDFKKPMVRFGVNVDQIDADRYLPPKQQGAAPATPEAAGAAATRLPIKLLRSLDVQGNLTIGKLTLSNAKMSNVKLSLNGKDGKIQLQPATAQLYQGTYSGSIGLDATGKVPKLTIDSKLEGIQAEPLLKDLNGKARLRGTGNFTAALTATGPNTNALKRTLSGKMSFSFKNGAIKGFNIGKMLRSVGQFKKEGTFAVQDQEETDFSELTGNPVAEDGVIRLDDLDGKSPAVRLGGKGVLANLRNNQINYVASATVVATAKGQGGQDLTKLNGVTIPVKIHGSLSDPKISPDLGGVATSYAKEAAKSAILKKLGVQQPATAKPGTQQPQKSTQQQVLDKALQNIFQPPPKKQ